MPRAPRNLCVECIGIASRQKRLRLLQPLRGSLHCTARSEGHHIGTFPDRPLTIEQQPDEAGQRKQHQRQQCTARQIFLRPRTKSTAACLDEPDILIQQLHILFGDA